METQSKMKQPNLLPQETKCWANLWQTSTLMLPSFRINNLGGRQQSSFIKPKQNEAATKIVMGGKGEKSHATTPLLIKLIQEGECPIFLRRKAVSRCTSWDRSLCTSHSTFLCSLQTTTILMSTCNSSASATSRCPRASLWWKCNQCNRCQDMSSNSGHEMLPTAKHRQSKKRTAWANRLRSLRNRCSSSIRPIQAPWPREPSRVFTMPWVLSLQLSLRLGCNACISKQRWLGCKRTPSILRYLKALKHYRKFATNRNAYTEPGAKASSSCSKITTTARASKNWKREQWLAAPHPSRMEQQR